VVMVVDSNSGIILMVGGDKDDSSRDEVIVYVNLYLFL